MICSSWPVPKVVTTRAWVSPRVNNALPWVRGRIPTSQAMGRTVLVSRPSMRRPVFRISLRTMAFSRLLRAFGTTVASNPASIPSAADSSAVTRSRTAVTRSWRVSLSVSA